MNAKTLGHVGLIPFVLLAVLAWVVRAEVAPFVALALVGYGAVVVSFLGGIHWGLAFAPGLGQTPTPQQRRHLLWGVLPSLLAWVAVLMPAYAATPLLAVLLVLCYGADRQLYPLAGLQAWLALRLRLTGVAALSCLVAAARM